MKIQFSGLGVTDGRGKIGGHVASKNRSGPYARVKVTPVNPQTAYQQAARNLLTSYSQGWRALTQAQRDAWDAAVGDFAKSDIFGNQRNPTGKNLYTALNANLSNIGQSPITDPPLPSGAGQVFAGPLVITNGGAKSIAHVLDTAGHTVQVWATQGVSPGKKFVKNDYRLITTFVGGAASPAVITTAYNNRFGQPAVGTRVSVMLVSVNDTTGEVSVGSEATTITV